MRFKNPTKEEERIDEAIEAHMEALEFEHHIFKGSVVLYFIGLPMLIFGSGFIEVLGLALTFTGAISFIGHLIFHLKAEKKRKAAAELITPYMKRKSQPLFNKMREKFADDPNIKLVHNEDGNISIMVKSDEERKP